MTIDEQIQAVAESLPTLTVEQRARLAALFRTSDRSARAS